MNFSGIFNLLSVICCLILQCQSDEPQPTVNIPSLGGLRGSRMVSSSGRKFHAFRGIPYAEPPVGNLRFNDPVPAKPWTGNVLDATKEGPSCLQNLWLSDIMAGQEDCLVLNVYTHNISPTENVLPVMVWIHGGGFTSGSGNSESDFYGPGHILDRDVVLVTLNYRLGPFGFLSTEDAEAPGNYGLLDQNLAIKWVKDHISNFGGNPDSITIFGESAGSASVEFQILSPHSKGLFHRAITQSGSASCPWATQTNVGEYTRILAGNLNCPTSNSRELLDCMRKIEAEKIMISRNKLTIPIALDYPVAFGPRIDSERLTPFLPDKPESIVQRKQFNQVPIISGLTKDEGGLFAAMLAANDGQHLELFKTDPVNALLYAMAMEKQKNGLEIAQKAYDHYFVNYEENDIAEQYGKFSSDIGFFKCVDDKVQLLSRFSDQPVYYYHYAHRAQHYSFANMFNVSYDADFGVCHADELLLMFTSNLIPLMTDPNDIKMSKMLLDLWTSFTANGVPQSDEIIGHWLPTTQQQPRYLQIDLESPALVNDVMPFHSRLDFWKTLFDSYSDVQVKEEL